MFCTIVPPREEKGLELDPTGQAALPVTIPFAVVTHAAEATVDPNTPLILRLLLPPTIKLISPVPPPPIDRVWEFVDCRLGIEDW